MKLTVLAAALVGLIATACGGGNGDHSSMNNGSTDATGAAAAPTRTVNVAMVDIAYEPKTLSVQQGERIEFVFDNKGSIRHDAFIGDAAAQADHEKEMGKEDSMAGDHDKANKADTGITVDPGQTGRLTYAFDKPGTIEIGCHEPGHYAAGMKVIVTVA